MQDQYDWYDSIQKRNDIVVLKAIDPKKEYAWNDGIGFCQLKDINWINRTWTSSHGVFDLARGAGYGNKILEAEVDFGFEVLNLHRVNAEVLITNIASLKNCSYVGLHREGIATGAVCKSGRFIDIVYLGLTYEDWKDSKRVLAYDGVCHSLT